MRVEIKAMSVNSIFQGRRFKTKEYKKWREEFGFLLMGQKYKTYTGKNMLAVKINFYVKNYKMIDLDNLAKGVLDSLVENGVIKDDRYIKTLKLAKYPIKDKEFIDITIRELN